MAQLPFMFDASAINPELGLGNLPVGKHVVGVTASEIKNTKDGQNQLLELELTVMSGEHQGETGAWRLNLFHSIDRTRQLAQKDFSRLCHAIGVMQVQDTQQIHNIPFGVEVALQKGSESMTEVKRVLTATGEDPAKATYTGPKVGSSSFTPPAPPAAPVAPVQPAAPVQPQVNVQPAAPAAGWAPQPAAPAAGGWAPNPAQAPAAAQGALPWGQ